MKLKNLLISLLVIILLALVGWAYWYFLMGPVKITLSPEEPGTPTGFQPINTGTTGGGSGGTGSAATTSGGVSVGNRPLKIPSLRLLSGTPVGGYGASTTASTTNILWIDRGRGNVYQASSDSLNITTLSNTVVPRIFESVWNKNLTSFMASLFEDGDLTPATVYTELIRKPSRTSSTTPASPDASSAPYELRGKNIAGNIIGYAASPDKSRLFTLLDENGSGVGYISAFNASNPTRLFTTPLTQLNVSWPSDNVIAITTKGSANYGGFLYFVNPGTGAWSKILGPLPGLSARVNDTGKYVLYSSTGKNNDILTGIYSVTAGTTTDAIVRTLADKCAWGNFYKELAYCGVPTRLVPGRYPDDWYLGTLSTVDKIWQVNAVTGEVKLVSSLIDQADRILNVFNLETDPKDKYLFFMNKNDLSLWSLDLVKPN